MSADLSELDREFHRSLRQLFGRGPVEGAAFDRIRRAVEHVTEELGSKFAKQHATYQHQPRSGKGQTQKGEIYEETVSQSTVDAFELVCFLVERVPRLLKRLDDRAALSWSPMTRPAVAGRDAKLVLDFLRDWKPEQADDENDDAKAEEEAFEFARVVLARAWLHGADKHFIIKLKTEMEAILKSRFGENWARPRRIRQLFLPRPDDSVRAWFFQSFKNTRRDVQHAQWDRDAQHKSIFETEFESEYTADAEVCEVEHTRLLEALAVQTALLPPRERFVLDTDFVDLQKPICWEPAVKDLPARLGRDATRRAKSLPQLTRRWAAEQVTETELRRRIQATLLDRSPRQISRYRQNGLQRLRAVLRAKGF